MNLLFLVPAHNEAACLRAVVAEVRDRYPEALLLVVDDGSTDDTQKLLEQLRVRSIRLERRSGVGEAVRRGLGYAREHGVDAVVRLDGDGQHPVDVVPSLLGPLANGAHAVVGSRYKDGRPDPTPPVRRMGQRAVASLVGGVVGYDVTDPTSGCWALGPRAIALLAERHPPGYAEPALYVLMHRNGLTVAEVAVRMRARLVGRPSWSPHEAGWIFARIVGTVIREATR